MKVEKIITMKPTISVIIPAYNEEKNLAGAVETAKESIKGLFSDYEILIFDDSSTDKTGFIADELAKNNSKIKVVHNNTNKGIGYNYTEGVKLASKEYTTVYTGANVVSVEDTRKVFKQAGKADIILSYLINSEIRPASRRIISKSFVILMNLINGLNIKYYNGSFLHKTELAKNLNITSRGSTYNAELISKLLKSGCSYIETGITLKMRQQSKTKFFKPNNLYNIFKFIIKSLLYREKK